MFAAALTTLFFALSAVTGQRVAMRLGGVWGNFVRLFIATIVLGGLVFALYPETLHRETFLWFFLSGLVGFGIGDVALFMGYERIGSRLTVLLNLCLAPLFAMALEYVWLGNGVRPGVIVCAAMIVTGVILALRPGNRSTQKSQRRGNYWVGVIAAITAGFGQGTGAVISRKAEAVATEVGIHSTGISAAFQRVFAGVVFAVVAVVVIRFFASRKSREHWKTPFDKKLAPWLLGAALFGPVIGVSCFQWALQTLESGIVLSVVALTPIVLMPLAVVTEGDHPSKLAIVGAVVAVAGVCLLYLWA